MAPDAQKWEYYPIKGVPVVKTSGSRRIVGVRQNIDEWSDNEANDKQVKLFVMALDRFQKIDPSKRESYFQVAGIHGQPNIPWDEPIPQTEADGKGYCTHNNILFPIWHRPYLALYEQRLYEIMVDDIIPKFPADVQQSWKDAANSWRLPFWDWARTTKVPRLARYPTTIVPTADGKGEERISNPLYQFIMPNNRNMGTEKVGHFKDPWVDEKEAETLYYDECVGTSRWPDEDDVKTRSPAWINGVVNNSSVEKALAQPTWTNDDKANPHGKPAEMVYRLLTVPMDYPTFATTAQSSDNVQNDLNIEFIHNNVHGWVGGDYNGHMSQIPVATFDPLFWLHHCNIDRIFALWQALNPDKWFEKGTVNEFFQSTIGLDEGKEITPRTPLRPFHADTKGTVLTPEDVRDTFDLGYTYPELQLWKDEYYVNDKINNAKLTSDLRKFINETYGHSRGLLQTLIDKLKGKGVQPIQEGIKSVDFAFSIRYRKYAFDGAPFWIRLYLAPDVGIQNPATDLISEVFNFSQKPDINGEVVCTNCVKGQENDVKATAYISITPILIALLRTGRNLPSLRREDVLQYLQKHIYWRVFRNGKELPRYEVDKVDLEIIGSSNDSTTYNDPTKPPKLENFKKEPTLTGGADGALDSSLKQPLVTPPPPVPQIPKGQLELGKTLPFKEEIKADSVVIIESTKLDLTKATTGGIDNTQFSFTDSESGGNILFHFSVRRAEDQIVFNTRLNGSWGQEVRIPLKGRFKSQQPTILVHDQGTGYEVFIDWVHALWFPKRHGDQKARAITYGVNPGQNPVWSKYLTVKVYSSMREVFNH